MLVATTIAPQISWNERLMQSLYSMAQKCCRRSPASMTGAFFSAEK